MSLVLSGPAAEPRSPGFGLSHRVHGFLPSYSWSTSPSRALAARARESALGGFACDAHRLSGRSGPFRLTVSVSPRRKPSSMRHSASVVAWFLVRVPFPGKRVIDALVDLPFALPTAVSGIALTTDIQPQRMDRRVRSRPSGSRRVHFPLGIVLRSCSWGCPSRYVRSSPPLEDLEPDWRRRPRAWEPGKGRPSSSASFLPVLAFRRSLTGFSLAFARGLGEYGSVVFIAGNMTRMKTECCYSSPHRDEAGAARRRGATAYRGGHASRLSFLLLSRDQRPPCRGPAAEREAKRWVRPRTELLVAASALGFLALFLLLPLAVVFAEAFTAAGWDVF